MAARNWMKSVLTTCFATYGFSKARHYWRRKQFFLCTERTRGHFWASGQGIFAFHCLLLLMVPNITGQDTVLPMSLVFFARAPFGPGGLVAECIEPYLYSAVDSRPGPGGSRTTASCQPEARRPRTIPLRYSVGCTTDVLGENYRQWRPALVNWPYPAFEQGALAPLVFLLSTFPIIVLPGDKIFQSKNVLIDFQLAPVTHAYGGSKSRVGKALQDKQHNPPLPLMAALRGANGLLPL